MRVHELLNPTKPRVLLEGRNLAVFEALSPLLRISEQGDGGEPGRYYPIFRPGGGMSPNFWFNELHRSLKNLAVASNVKKRLKELGVQGEGAKRVNNSVKRAAKAVKFLFNKPGGTAYKIPIWTTQNTLPKPVIKMWNEAFERAFHDELSKIDLNE